jgi:hypothetical protein
MHGLIRQFEPNTRSSMPFHEKIVDRIYLVMFVALLSVMGFAYFCLVAFLLWAFFWRGTRPWRAHTFSLPQFWEPPRLPIRARIGRPDRS